MNTVKLAPFDAVDAPITVKTEVAKMSVTLRDMIEDFGGQTDCPIPVSNVTKKTLERVVAWCEYHFEQPDAKPVVDPNVYVPTTTDTPKKELEISQWDTEFFNVEQPALFELILAANYLNIKPMLDIGCKTVAGLINGKKPEEIRKIFNIKNDFTPEEEEKVRKENEWCEV